MTFGKDLDVVDAASLQVPRVVVLGREGQVDDQVQVGLAFSQQPEGPGASVVV